MRTPILALLAAAALFARPLVADACTWKLVTTPSGGPNNVLHGVAGSSTSDVWNVGGYYTTSFGPYTLAEHWNGSAWTVFPTPNPGPNGNQLVGVADLTPTNAWAVGSQSLASGGFQALILHWNGKTWTQVKAPTVAGYDTNLQAITAVSAQNIWADGLQVATSGGIQIPLVEHYDGKSWSIIPSPNSGTYGSTIYTISAAGGKDIWATGGVALNAQDSDYATLAMHWTGSKWTIVPTPNVGSTDNLLNGVVNVAPGDAWAVGNSYDPTKRIFNTLTEHWNGTKWSIVKSPTVGAYGNGLFAAGAVSSTSVWAVGEEFTSGAGLTLTLKWNGKVWAHVKSPNLPGGDPDFLTAVAGIPGTTTVWAVGLNTVPSNGNVYQPLTTVNACALSDSGDDAMPPALRFLPPQTITPHALVR